MLFQGASCRLTDDWKLEQKRLERQTAITQKTEAMQAEQEVQQRLRPVSYLAFPCLRLCGIVETQTIAMLVLWQMNCSVNRQVACGTGKECCAGS